MTRFYFSAATESITKINPKAARTLKATTALASAIGLGIAVIAPLVLTTRAQAADLEIAGDSSPTWASEAGQDSSNIANASADDNVNFAGDGTLIVTNNGFNQDSSHTHIFTLGEVTATNSGEGTIAIQGYDDVANYQSSLSVRIGSAGTDADGDPATAEDNKSIKALTVDGGNADGNTEGNNATADFNSTTAYIFDTITLTGGDGGNAANTTAGRAGGQASLYTLRGATGNIILKDGNAGTSTFKDDGSTKAAGGSGGTAFMRIRESSSSPVDQTITGSISAFEDGDGEMQISVGVTTNVTVTGDVGASDKAIGLIEQTSGNLSLKSDLNVTDFTHVDGDLTFNGTTAQTITVVDDDANDDTTTAGLVLAVGSTTSDLSVDNATGVTFTTAVTLSEGNVVVGGLGASVATFSDALTLTKGNLEVGNGTAASSSTFSGDVTLTDGDIIVAADSTATFGDDITVAHSAGALTATAGGTMVISGGTAVEGETHNVTTLTTGATTTARVADGGTLKLNNTLKLANDPSDLTFLDGSTLELGIISGTAIDASENEDGVIASGAINIVASNAMKSGNQVILVNHISSGLDANTYATINDRRFMTFAITEDTANNNVVLTAASKPIPDIAEELSISETNAERLLTAFNNSTNPEFAEFVGGEATDAQAALIADQAAVQEETLTASAGTISGAATQVAGITADRLASLRTGEAYGLEAEQAASGFATGDGAMNRNMWGKLFFNTASQDNSRDADGYDSDTNGFVLGSDTEINPNMRAGVSLAITRSDVDGKGGGDAQTDIDGYQLTVYGDFTQSDYFVDWQVGASMSNVETLTEVDPLSGSSSSNSEYDSLSYLAKVGLGTPMDMGDGTRWTPYGSFSFQRITSDEYTLIFPNDPGLNQTVVPDDVDEFTASLGGRYTVAIETEEGATLSPQVRGALSYNFIGNTAEATSTYADGTELTVKGVEAEKFGASLGVGITYASDATTLGFDIDSTLKDGYASYTGALNFRLQF